MRVQHVEPTFNQNLPNPPNATELVDRAIHWKLMHRNAFFHQPSGKAAARSTDRLQMVTPLPQDLLPRYIDL